MRMPRASLAVAVSLGVGIACFTESYAWGIIALAVSVFLWYDGWHTARYKANRRHGDVVSEEEALGKREWKKRKKPS